MNQVKITNLMDIVSNILPPGKKALINSTNANSSQVSVHRRTIVIFESVLVETPVVETVIVESLDRNQ